MEQGPHHDEWRGWLWRFRGNQDQDVFDDDEVIVEPITDMEWHLWLHKANNFLFHRLLPMLPSMCYITALEILGLAKNRRTKYLFSVSGGAFKDERVHSIHIDFDGLEESIASLSEFSPMNTKKLLPEAAASLGKFLGEMEFIETLTFDGCGAVAVPLFAEILRQCQSIELLEIHFLSFDGEESEVFLEALPYLYDALEKHRSLEYMYFRNIMTTTLRRLGSALVTIPSLKTCCLVGNPSRACLEIVSLEDVEVIRSILSNPGLELFGLKSASFADEEMVLGVCEAIRRSHIKQLETFEWAFPETMNGKVASLLTRSEHIDKLDYRSPCTLGIFEAFSVALANAPTNLQTFEMTTEKEGFTGTSIALLLKHADQWKIKSLTLSVAEWTDALDQALAKYVKNTPCLETLSLKFTVKRGFDDAPILPVASPALIDAARFGSRTLEYFMFPHDYSRSDPAWLPRLQYVLKTNRRRRICSSIMQDTACNPKEKLILVFDKLNMSMLFEFLIENELDLQTLVIRYGGSASSRCLSPPGRRSTRILLSCCPMF